MHKKKVCMGCTRRRIGCHAPGVCPEWDTEEAAHKADQIARKKEQQEYRDYIGVLFDPEFTAMRDRAAKKKQTK